MANEFEQEPKELYEEELGWEQQQQLENEELWELVDNEPQPNGR